MAEPTPGRERRAFYRVEAHLPIRVRPVEMGEAELMGQELSSEGGDPFEDLDPALVAWLQRLESKLEVLLARVEERAPNVLGPRDVQRVELSGAGLAFQTDADDLGDQVVVEFQLPGPPSRLIRALAHPVFFDQGSGEGDGDATKRGRAAFAFDVISDADREAIVHFSHDVQRKQLRDRHRRRDARG